MSNITNDAYMEMTKSASPKSKSYKNIPLAFLFGGAICTFGEWLINLYTNLGMERDIAMSSASITLIFIAILLTGLNVYDSIAKYAGAGTLVPITGFANAVSSPALEFKTEGYISGVGTKMFVIAGPVIVYGLVAGMTYGLVLYLFKLY